MTILRPDDRTDPPLQADEAGTLLGFLAFQRDTLRWKCAGLTAEQLATPLPPSTLTLGGLLMHLAVVEAGWLNLTFAGGVARPSWLGEMDPDDEAYEAKATVLAENVRHHVREEEDELFPAVRSALGRKRLVELADEMQRDRESAIA